MKINKADLDNFICSALKEDVGAADHTSIACIPADAESNALLLVKDDGILAGVELATYILQFVDPESKIEVQKRDGDFVHFGDIAFTARGNTRALLQAERLLLNCMQRMSGIASLTSRYITELSGLKTKLLDTRKTTPLIRFLEKWAVQIGGGNNYRAGLYDWVMIKDNHIKACGSPDAALGSVKKYFRDNYLKLGVTLEVGNLMQLQHALKSQNNDILTRIMFDNFELPLLMEGIDTVGGRFETEASGGITLPNIRKYAETGVDYISVGALTHSVESLDLSFKFR